MELEKIKTEAKKYGVPIIRTQSYQILSKIVHEKQPKHILEIGTAVGYSGITMLENTNGKLITIEHDDEKVKQAKQNFQKAGLSSKVQIMHDDCMVALAKLVSDKKFNEYFDFIFLDGPKAQYNNMLEALVFLLKPNGILLADNVLFRGYVLGENKPVKRFKTISKRLDEFIKNCKNHPFLVNFKLFNTEDGIIYAEKVSNEKK